jgi:hypothetical protein
MNASLVENQINDPKRTLKQEEASSLHECQLQIVADLTLTAAIAADINSDRRGHHLLSPLFDITVYLERRSHLQERASKHRHGLPKWVSRATQSTEN